MGMHILQLASSYPPAAYGGDASQVEALHHALNGNGSHCSTIYFRLHSEIDATAAQVMAIASECDLRRLHNEGALHRINKLAVSAALKLPTPQVIHLHTTLFAMAAITLSQIWKCPLVYTAHYPAKDYLADPQRTQNIQRAEALIIEKAGIVVCVSRWLREQLAAAYPAAAGKMRVIYNGVDTDIFCLGVHRRDCLLYAGRLTAQKGLDNLAPLVQRIQDRIDLPLAVLGKGEEEDALRCSLAGCNVMNFGSVPANEVPGWLNRTAALLLPSRWDPCPLIALEAMACGVPVLGSDIPGLNELVTDHETGLLEKLGNNFAPTMAQRFIRLYNDRAAYKKMSGRCRQRAVADFSLSKMTHNMLSVYREIAAGLPTVAAASRDLRLRLTIDGQTLSPESFGCEWKRIAVWLAGQGVEQDAVLLLPGLSNASLVFLTPAVIFLNASLVLTPPAAELATPARLSGAQWLCADQELPDYGYWLQNKYTCNHLTLWLYKIDPPAARPFRGNGAVYFTSGTTAVSRAVFREWDKLFAEVTAYAKHLNLPDDSEIAALVPLYHSYGFGSALINALCLGAHLHCSAQLSSTSLRQLLKHEHYDLVIASPQALWLCAQAANGVQCKVDRAISSGAPLSLATAETVKKLLGWEVRQQYGSSETGAISVDQWTHSDPSTVGQPLPGVSVTVTTNGEIEVVSPFAATEYLQDNSRGRFADGVFRPGDCGHFNLAGDLFVTGRVDDEVAVAGKRVRLNELQQFLQALPDIELARIQKNAQNGLVCGLRIELYGKREGLRDMVIEQIKERFGSFPLQLLFRRADDATMQGVVK